MKFQFQKSHKQVQITGRIRALSIVSMFLFSFCAVHLLALPKAGAVPVNGKIVFMQTDGPSFSVGVMDSDGSNRETLDVDSLGLAIAGYPSISPDGTKIAFAGSVDMESINVYVKSENSITLVYEDLAYPIIKWSPDGSSLFVSGSDGYYVVGDDGTGKTKVINENTPAIAYSPWNTDSNSLYYTKMSEDAAYIYRVNKDGTNDTKISTAYAYMSTVKPDGTVLFIGTTNLNSDEFFLYQVDPDGSNEQQLADLSILNQPTSLQVSPDGQKLAITNNSAGHDSVYVTDSNGANATQVVNEVDLGDFPSINWSPDSTKLAMMFEGQTLADIFTVNNDGTGLTNITNTLEVGETFFGTQAWGPIPGTTDSNSGHEEENIPSDLNGDNVPDSEQSNVSVLSSPNSGKPVLLEVLYDCTVGDSTIFSESSNNIQDGAYSYPEGFVAFTADCISYGYTATIKIYYYDTTKDGLVLRKYNPSTNAYFNLTGQHGATLEQTTINNRTVTVAAYQITDGGDLDMDNQQNGFIQDPVGIATQTTGSANTGIEKYWLLGIK